MQRQIFKTIALLVAAIATGLTVCAQTDTDLETYLQQMLDDNDRRFTQLQQQGSDSTGVGFVVSQLEDYMRLLQDPAKTAVVEQHSNVPVVLHRLALLYKAVNSSKIETVYNFANKYFTRNDIPEYMNIVGVGEQYYFYLCQQQRFFMASEVAVRLDSLVEATADSTLLSAVTKSYAAYAYGMQNNVTRTEKWLNAAHEAGKDKAETCDNDFLVQRYGDMLLMRAQFFAGRGNYGQAESTLDELLRLVEKHYGESSLFYVNGLLAKADLLTINGRMGEVKRLCDKTELLLSALTDVDPQVRQNLQAALTNFRSRIGISASSDELSTTLMPNADTTAVALWQAANEAIQKNLWQEVVSRGKQWLDYVEQTKMVSPRDYDIMLSMITQALLMDRRFPEAAQLLEHSRQFVVQNNVIDPQPDRFILQLQGKVHKEMGDAQRALQFYNESKGMYEKAGDHSLFFVMCLNEMADAYFTSGDMAYCKLFIDELLQYVDTMTDGLDDETTNQLALFRHSAAAHLSMMGYDMVAIDELKRSFEYYETHNDIYNMLGVAISLLSAYIKTKDIKGMEELLAKAQHLPLPPKEVKTWLWGSLLFRNDPKAIEVLREINRDAQSEMDEVKKSFTNSESEIFWQSRTIQLAYYNNITALRFPTYPDAQQLAYDNALYVRRADMNQVVNNWADVRRSLRSSDVAVEMVVMTEMDQHGEERKVYGALVLRHDYEAPRLVRLCYTDELNGVWRDQLHTDTAFVNRLYALPHSELYPLAWQPIEPLLHEGDHVYYVPTGYLSQINFEALSSNGVRLADRYHLHRLSTTAQVIGRSEGVSLNNCRNAAVYGDINYAATEEQMAASAAAYLHRAKTDTLLLATRSAAGRGALAALPPLPGTGEEARQISRMMKEKGLHVDLFMGTQANEESMKAYSGHSPQIVHIGTHGFILNTTRDITDHQSFLESIFASEDQQKSALNYTGLMFAGAENVWCGETVPEGVEDGILTSSELSQLDFSHTDLMVLSACETALGHFDESLGEFGLQRALKQAGVNTLVMSLWEVPDEPTQLLMTSFYKQLLSGVECHQALIQARETVRRVYPQPYCWAAFIIVD